MAVKVVGMGNRLYGDDAIGSIAAICMNSFDAEANGFQALAYIKKGDIVFFIDAMIMEEDFNLFRINLEKDIQVEISDPHRLSPIQIVELARKSGNAPKEAYILAIKPEKIDMPGISDKVIERARSLFEKYKDFLGNYGINVNVEEIVNCIESKKDKPWY
ncbi:hydrogenase maturation protease [Saccharolobus shibatae]|uniref:Hydrogenase maturation protease n=1 Tax=Saccharolobus shibatae TaxID=2286 RepID=A0A8F5GZW3_9CREN|nr:hydrogenase maturation protease [Saccharolobus shibatae]QXJ35536.1 hypothetical protein J5U22_02083 [Saccharolobus shibatae]